MAWHAVHLIRFWSSASLDVQVYLLDCLAAQSTSDIGEADALITRVSSRLQHANSAVVLAAVKVVLCHLDAVKAPETQADFLRKLAAPLVTLLSQRPEIQYVALRNVNLILQKYPDILATEARVFYCKYNDPIYVKLEKLEIMVALATENNIVGVFTPKSPCMLTGCCFCKSKILLALQAHSIVYNVIATCEVAGAAERMLKKLTFFRLFCSLRAVAVCAQLAWVIAGCTP
jgi:hypothetical protein